MLLKSLLSLIVLNLTFSAHAEEAKAAEKKLVAVNYHGEYYIMRSETDNLSDLNVMHNPTVTLNLPRDMKLTTTAEFNYSKAGDGKFPNRLYRGLVTLSKSNLLTEKEFGVQVDAAVARRYFDTRAQDNLTSAYGNTRINTTLTKNFGDNNASLLVQYLLNDVKYKNKAEQWKHGLELIPLINYQLTKDLTFTFTDDIIINTPYNSNTKNSVTMSHEASFAVLTYKLNDLYSVYLQPKWTHTEEFVSDANTDKLKTFLGVTHVLSSKATATLEIGMTAMDSNDHDLFSKKFSKPELAMYYDIAF